MEARGKGVTWRKIAMNEGTNKSTLYEWFSANPEFKAEIKKQEKDEQRDNIRQTLLEVAIKDKNVTALIYLSKAVLKMWDTPKAVTPEDDKPKEPLHPPMTREEWRKKHEEMLKRKEQK